MKNLYPVKMYAPEKQGSREVQKVKSKINKPKKSNLPPAERLRRNRERLALQKKRKLELQKRRENIQKRIKELEAAVENNPKMSPIENENPKDGKIGRIFRKPIERIFGHNDGMRTLLFPYKNRRNAREELEMVKKNLDEVNSELEWVEKEGAELNEENKEILANVDVTKEEKKVISKVLHKMEEQEKKEWKKSKDSITSIAQMAQHMPAIQSTSKELNVKSGAHPDKKEALQMLLSWGSIVYQGLNGQDGARIFLRDKKAFIRIAGQDFELKTKNATENYVNMMIEMSQNPLMKAFLRSGYHHGLKPLEEAFALKYSTEKIGDYKEHFYEVVFSELKKSTGKEFFNIRTREAFDKFFEKIKNPLHFNELKLALLGTHIFDNEGKISDITLEEWKRKQEMKNIQDELNMI